MTVPGQLVRGWSYKARAHPGSAAAWIPAYEVQNQGRGEEAAAVSVKEQMIHSIHNQPDDSSYDEILKELSFHRMIERGLADIEQGRTISNQEMGRRIRSWSN